MMELKRFDSAWSIEYSAAEKYSISTDSTWDFTDSLGKLSLTGSISAVNSNGNSVDSAYSSVHRLLEAFLWSHKTSPTTENVLSRLNQLMVQMRGAIAQSAIQIFVARICLPTCLAEEFIRLSIGDNSIYHPNAHFQESYAKLIWIVSKCISVERKPLKASIEELEQELNKLAKKCHNKNWQKTLRVGRQGISGFEDGDYLMAMANAPPFVTEFHLAGCFRDSKTMTLKMANHIETVSLCGNSLNSADFSFCQSNRLSRLRELNLTSCSLTSTATLNLVQIFSQLTKLRRLLVGQNPDLDKSRPGTIAKALPAGGGYFLALHLHRLRDLEVLDISNCNLRGFTIEKFAKEFNKIGKRYCRLRSLNFSGNPVIAKYAGKFLSSLLSLEQLDSIGLQECGITAEQMKSFRQQKRNVEEQRHEMIVLGL